MGLPQIQWVDPWLHPDHTGNICPPAATWPPRMNANYKKQHPQMDTDKIYIVRKKREEREQRKKLNKYGFFALFALFADKK